MKLAARILIAIALGTEFHVFTYLAIGQVPDSATPAKKVDHRKNRKPTARDRDTADSQDGYQEPETSPAPKVAEASDQRTSAPRFDSQALQRLQDEVSGLREQLRTREMQERESVKNSVPAWGKLCMVLSLVALGGAVLNFVVLKRGAEESIRKALHDAGLL